MPDLTHSTLALDGVNEGDTVPVTRTAEVWAVATLNTQRQVTELLRSLNGMLSDGSAPIETILEKLQYEIGRSVEAEAEAWHLFNAQAERTGHQVTSLEAMGPPDSITFDSTSGIPFMAWRANSLSIEHRWRQFTVEDVGTGAIAHLTAPFRPVVLENLPEGTKVIEIRDTRHQAIIAINEVLQAAMTDIRKGLDGEDALSTWGRIRAQAGFYKTFVRACLKDVHLQQYKEWLNSVPQRIDFKHAPSLIVKHHNSTVTMQILVLRTTVDLFVDVMDRAEKANWDNMPGAVQHALNELELACASMADVLASMNRLEMLTVDHPERYDVETFFRTNPRNVPVIALVPREVNETSNKIMPFPGRKTP